MASGVYNEFKADILKKVHDLVNDTVKVALLTSSASFDADNDNWADISANEVSGTGYSAGGAALGSKTVTTDNTNDRASFDGADTTWSTSTITARFAAVYDDTHASDRLICLFDFGSNQSSSAGNFTIQWHANGILLLT